MGQTLTKSWLQMIGDRPVRVMLADGEDPRSVEAARLLADTTPIIPILADRAYVAELAALPPIAAVLSQALAKRASHERRVLARSALYVSAAAVRTGLADACVGGSQRPTAEVVRAAFRVLGMAPEASTVTSCFLMGLTDGRVIAYADCAVVPQPDEAQLAEIAIATSRTFVNLTVQDPVVAMLSFSTMGSASHHRVDSVWLEQEGGARIAEVGDHLRRRARQHGSQRSPRRPRQCQSPPVPVPAAQCPPCQCGRAQRPRPRRSPRQQEASR